MKLVVISPFANFAKGEEITDATLVQSVLEGPNRSDVVRVAVPEQDPGAAPAHE